MKNIEIDDDLYMFIASRTQSIGESASSILRRELGLGVATVQFEEKREGVTATHELTEFLDGPLMRYGNAKDKYLKILGEAYRLKPDQFASLLSMRGRHRVYFADDKAAIEANGSTTHPEKIPGTPFWALTNESTLRKKRLLSMALARLDFSDGAKKAARNAL